MIIYIYIYSLILYYGLTDIGIIKNLSSFYKLFLSSEYLLIEFFFPTFFHECEKFKKIYKPYNSVRHNDISTRVR